jgi:DNA (cytosine-5)-methyltransferase 1
MNFLDLFAGIGGFRLGMERAGHKCIGYCEIDKFARMSYQAIHDTKGEIDYKDITEVTNEEFRKLKGTVDVICGGFPCQAFSIAGKQLGFKDARGTLFYEIARAAKEIKPRYLFLENVRNLLSHDKGKTFAAMLTILDELGYDAEWQVLNSKNFGVPQNRERVFIVGHLRGECTSRVFPIQGENKESDREPKIKILGNVKNPNCRSKGTRSLVHDKNGIVEALTATDYKEPKKVAINFPKILQIGRGFNKGGVHNIAPTITKNSYQENNFLSIKEATKQGYAIANIGDSINLSHPNSKTRRGRVGKNIANTLLTSDEQGVVLSDYKIRKLTPRECWRLQGFPDWAFDKAQKVNSNSQLYKQAGNSVTVNVIEEIAKKLK